MKTHTHILNEYLRYLISLWHLFIITQCVVCPIVFLSGFLIYDNISYWRRGFHTFKNTGEMNNFRIRLYTIRFYSL